MKARKLLSMLLVRVTVVSLLAGCSSGAGSSDGDTAEETTADSQEDTQDTADASDAAQDASAAEVGSVLGVYYSATGHTEEAANMIADATGGTLFELEPVEPYTDEDLNYNDEDSRVSREHEDESLRDVELVSTTGENWDSYDPFTGKTVIPFCTSSSSDIGDSGNLLADLAGTGDWQEGMRFRSGADEADVQDWVNGLGL